MSGDDRDAVSPCEYLPWDSQFFGLRIGRVVQPGSLSEAALQRIERWCDAEQIDCVYLFNDGDDIETGIRAEEHGFRLVDVRVTYESRVPGERPKPPSNGVIRPFRNSDLPTLVDIAGRSHHGTRFYADPHFSRQQCDDLYRVWLRKSCEGWANQVLVAELHGKPCGYLTVHLDRPDLGRVGLVAVAGEARNRGIGTLLVSASLDWMAGQSATRAIWSTQGRNIPGQRLCGRTGFELVSTGLWHHRWRV